MFLQEDLLWPFYLLFCGLLRRGILVELIFFLPAIFRIVSQTVLMLEEVFSLLT